jgi:glycosyltransferase involved in cell wall biosynthesis
MVKSETMTESRGEAVFFMLKGEIKNVKANLRTSGYFKEGLANKPLVSIITSTFNAAAYLPKAVKSIQALNYENYEWIVIDADSNDGTLELIKQHQNVIDYWVSEPDTGIYDAWNKALSIAKGEWICFLGADDLIMPNSISELLEVQRLSEESLDFIYGRVELYKNNKHLRTIGIPWSWSKFKRYFSVTHPCALHNTSYFKRYGEFDTSFKITGDYEMLLRAGSNLKVGFVDSVVAKMQMGGLSNANSKVFQEALRARLMHHVTTPVFGAIHAKCSEIKWRVRRIVFGI